MVMGETRAVRAGLLCGSIQGCTVPFERRREQPASR